MSAWLTKALTVLMEMIPSRCAPSGHNPRSSKQMRKDWTIGSDTRLRHICPSSLASCHDLSLKVPFGMLYRKLEEIDAVCSLPIAISMSLGWSCCQGLG